MGLPGARGLDARTGRRARDALKDCSNKGGIVFDCFGGSGTTLIAAEQTGRRARLIELDPADFDVTNRRWESDTGGKAIRVQGGRSFSENEKEGL